MRWRDQPREPLFKWGRTDLAPSLPVCVIAWLLAGRLLVVDVAAAEGFWPTVGMAAAGLGTLAVACGLTWVGVLYVRRPVDTPLPPPPETRPEDRAREESERRAWRSRRSP